MKKYSLVLLLTGSEKFGKIFLEEHYIPGNPLFSYVIKNLKIYSHFSPFSSEVEELTQRGMSYKEWEEYKEQCNSEAIKQVYDEEDESSTDSFSS